MTSPTASRVGCVLAPADSMAALRPSMTIAPLGFASGGLTAPARALAETLLAEALPDRWQHVRRVAITASGLSASIALPAAEQDLVTAAAWLHDVGYSPTLLRSLAARSLGLADFHPLDGATYLHAEGWPQELVGLVAHHSLADVEALHRGVEPDLARFVDTPGPIRDVLWVADVTSGPCGEQFTIAQRLDDVTARYGPNHLVSECMALAAMAAAAALRRLSERAAAVDGQAVSLSMVMK